LGAGFYLNFPHKPSQKHPLGHNINYANQTNFKAESEIGITLTLFKY